MYELDHDFHSIKRQQKSKTEFYDLFQKAIDNYIDGDWVNAQSNLASAVLLKPHDGPLTWMQEFMDNQKNLAPEDWSGIRDLDLKKSMPEIDNNKIAEISGNAD